ncbi:MAG TPA: hypothetical protein VFX05_05340, partial [Casimicrobiaceae bacterium]|nr:hypothetical protein [Casimicrobiaceae bacterium]
EAREPREQREPREAREPRERPEGQPRGERPPRKEAPVPVAAADQEGDTLPVAEGAQAEGDERRDGSRRRRGRRGRGNGDRPAQPQGSEQALPVAAGAEVSAEEQAHAVAPLAEGPSAGPATVTPATEGSVDSTIDAIAGGVDVKSIPVQVEPDSMARVAQREPAPPPASEPISVAAPEAPVVARAVAPARAPANLPEIPPVSMSLPEDSGLELVQTKPREGATTVDEAPAEPRARRVRPPRAAAPEEPLQMVETRHGDGQSPNA